MVVADTALEQRGRPGRFDLAHEPRVDERGQHSVHGLQGGARQVESNGREKALGARVWRVGEGTHHSEPRSGHLEGCGTDAVGERLCRPGIHQSRVRHDFARTHDLRLAVVLIKSK